VWFLFGFEHFSKRFFFFYDDDDDDDDEIPHVDDELFLARALQVSLLLF